MLGDIDALYEEYIRGSPMEDVYNNIRESRPLEQQQVITLHPRNLNQRVQSPGWGAVTGLVGACAMCTASFAPFD